MSYISQPFRTNPRCVRAQHEARCKLVQGAVRDGVHTRGSIRSFRGTSGGNWKALGFRRSSLKILGGFLPLARCLLSHPESINLGSSSETH